MLAPIRKQKRDFQFSVSPNNYSAKTEILRKSINLPLAGELIPRTPSASSEADFRFKLDVGQQGGGKLGGDKKGDLKAATIKNNAILGNYSSNIRFFHRNAVEIETPHSLAIAEIARPSLTPWQNAL